VTGGPAVEALLVEALLIQAQTAMRGKAGGVEVASRLDLTTNAQDPRTA
jgi:hypothetical protein